ncbi:GNAT family N-acetyltransferase [Oxynema sp. CENA135]|nr:GNAT family N-acetyltransferase [Oxynema sp. CENA135]
MSNYFSRSYHDRADLEAIAPLLERCKIVDPDDEWPSISDILLQFDRPAVDKTRDVRLWETATGEAIAVAGIMLDNFLWFRIHPDYRSEALHRAILQWGEARMSEIARKIGENKELIVGAIAENHRRIAILESCGFTIARYFLTMVRSLAEAIAEPQLPEGFTLRAPNGEADAEAWVTLFNETFREHWNYHPETLEGYRQKLKNPEFRASLSRLAIAPNGEMAAFCDAYITAEGVSWLNPVGTAPNYRKRGLARAVLHAVLQELKAAGIETALLYVDADNLSGAVRLYESVGFRTINTQIAYSKIVVASLK